MPTELDLGQRPLVQRPACRRVSTAILAGLVLVGLALAGPASAHDGHAHAPQAKTKSKSQTEPAKAAGASATKPGQFLDGKIGGDFALTDQHDRRRQRADFAGRNVLLFFGYAQCESICSAAIPLMSQVVDQLGDKGKTVDLVLITVDPERDTPEGLRAGLAKYDPRFIGLTGTREALEPVWNAFQIGTKEVSRDDRGQPVFAHGSFIYLLGLEGEVKAVLPPVLSSERIESIVRSYLP